MIEFHDVSKTFAGRPAASHLNLNFAEGAFSVLIGTSGSGKSTTLKMINRLVEHDSGVIRFAGEENPQPAGAGAASPDGLCHSVYRPVSPLDGGAEHRHRAAAGKMVAGENRRSC